MRIAKPILMVTTPIGVCEGIYECYKLAGGLVFIMVAMIGVCTVALATVIAVIRREATPQTKEHPWQS
jgi:phage shock protein PspC (stress-responsive transcriptional regulator)